ncbi:integration host factor, actinobacterial type [Eggerthellaceae bacterium 24-137]
MPAPTMTPEQRAAALEKARIVRAKRSEITNKLSMGLTTPAEVLDQIDDPVIGRMKVKAFVNALPGFGKVKTEKLMEELGIPAERRLQGLGSNQMAALKAALA